MNNTINYSHFADLLDVEYSIDKDVQPKEQNSRDNTLSIDNRVMEQHHLLSKVEFK